MRTIYNSFGKSRSGSRIVHFTTRSSNFIIHNQALFHTRPTLRMKAARVTDWTAPPEPMEVPDLPAPSADQLQLKILAVGVPRAVKGRAARKHPPMYNSPLPFDPSIDGVGVDEKTNELYFINSFAAPLFAERANVARDEVVKLDAGTDPVTVAALSNASASSWMALQCRAMGGCKGRTVVVMGATSITGRTAVAVAHALGAARVIGISRSADTLATVDGLDERVVLESPLVMPADIGPVHIILDYIGGTAAIDLLKSVEFEPGQNVQYIQVGGLAGDDTLVVPARLINVKPIVIMASGIGSITPEDLKREMPGLVHAMTKMKRPFDVLPFAMADVATVWDSEEARDKRLVLVP